jgi:hypothetical protein
MAIDPDGNVLWNTPIDRVWSAPAIAPDGTIYQNTSRGILHAVDRAGRIKWTFEAPGPMNRNPSPPAIAEDGTIYFASEDGHMYALDAGGRERWRFATAGPVRPASIGLDGTIYFANDRALAGSGRDYVAVSESRMYALNPDGTERWSAPLPEAEVWAGPAIGFDGTIYMGTYNGRGGIYVFAPDGSLLRKLPGHAPRSPIVAGDGSIYSGAIGFDGKVYDAGGSGGLSASDGDGTPRWGFRQWGVVRDPYVLRAFEELGRNNGGYQAAPWPTERGDRANTGRARKRP